MDLKQALQEFEKRKNSYENQKQFNDMKKAIIKWHEQKPLEFQTGIKEYVKIWRNNTKNENGKFVIFQIEILETCQYRRLSNDEKEIYRFAEKKQAEKKFKELIQYSKNNYDMYKQNYTYSLKEMI